MTTKVTATVLGTNAATDTQVADDSVDTDALQDGAVTADKLGALAVTTAKIDTGAVTDTKLATGSVTNTKLGTGAVTATKLDTDAVETAKIKDLNVTTAKLADSAVTKIKMATNSVDTAQLVDNAVTNIKITDATITAAKLAFTASSAGLTTAWVPARAIYPSAANGASATVLSFASDTKISVPVITFSTSVKQYAEFCVFMPKSYNQGNINLYPVWTHPSTTVNFGVMWEASKLHVGDGSSLDTALGSIVQAADTGGSTSFLYKGPVIALTGGSPAVDKMAFFKVARDVVHASDNLAVAAYLVGIVMQFTTDKANDA